MPHTQREGEREHDRAPIQTEIDYPSARPCGRLKLRVQHRKTSTRARIRRCRPALPAKCLRSSSAGSAENGWPPPPGESPTPFGDSAPRASSMFARFMHAMVMIRPISTAKNPTTTGFNSRGNRHHGAAGEQSHASGFVGPRRIRRILLVETARDRVETGFGGFNRDAGRQAHQRQERLRVALMQHVVREFRRERGRHRRPARIAQTDSGQRAFEILRRDSHDGRGLPVQAQRLSQRIGRGVEPIAPETIGDHHHRARRRACPSRG